MEINELCSVIESLLFAYAEPVSVNKLVDVIEMPREDILNAIEQMRIEYSSDKRGIMIYKLEDKIQLATKGENGEYIKRIMDNRRNITLTPASLEVLSIVAYNQPITRAYIEQVRGVDCTAVINSLVEKELIEEKGKLDAPGRPLLFGTTANFLRCFNITSLDNLPDLPEIPKPQKPDDGGEQLSLEEEI
ncbi:MAG: SMC-Scp complex subunit ScpB [Clostridia bacterium]